MQDPGALALAELNGGVAGNKQKCVASNKKGMTVSADHYDGIATPLPGQDRSQAFSRSVPASRINSDATARLAVWLVVQ